MAGSIFLSNFLIQLALMVCFFSCNLKVAHSSFKRVDFLLTRFSNPRNKTAKGKCCDGDKNAPSCSDSCETYFLACIPSFDKQYPDCYVKNHSKIIFNSSEFILDSKSRQSSLVTIVDPPYWSNISFTLALYDDDTPPRKTFSGENCIYYFCTCKPSESDLIIKYTKLLPTFPSRNWTQGRYAENGISFEFLYRIVCPKNHYGEKCQKVCSPTKYTTCLQDGTSTCRRGYTGKNCRKANCPESCLKNGWCDTPNNCSCLAGWKGPTCSQCIPDKKCLHGYCKTGPGECRCNSGWMGIYCNIDQKYCSHHRPCKNGGTCWNNSLRNYTCRCPAHYTGTNCESFICSSSCNLTRAECVTGEGCRCHRGWSGADCNQCVKNTSCINGYCEKPFECLCNDGWTGALCNISMNRNDTCNDSKPCQNNGSCTTMNNGTNYCICGEGFSGQYCENVICSPTCNLTRADCTAKIGCSCHRGWSGADCNQCVKHPSCINGYCEEPFECLCNDSWTGASCNISMTRNDTCNDSKPCQNNGSCRTMKNGTNYCICGKRFGGQYCENVICSPACNLTRADCTPRIGCSCHRGWSGVDCNQCVKHPSCINGYCEEPFECLCNDGWTGASCNISMTRNDTCNDSNPCQNNGTCRTMNNGTNYCICGEGFSGQYCENAICFPNCSRTPTPCTGGRSCRPKEEKSISSGGIQTIAISVSVAFCVLVISLIALYLLCEHFRRRANFHVTTPEVFFNNNGMKQSYFLYDDDEIISNTNNNFPRDFTTMPSTEIVMNPILVSQTANGCNGVNGKNTRPRSLNRSDSGFIEEDS